MALSFSPNFKNCISLDFAKPLDLLMSEIGELTPPEKEGGNWYYDGTFDKSLIGLTEVRNASHVREINCDFSHDSNFMLIETKTAMLNIYRTSDASLLCSLPRNRFRFLEASCGGSLKT